MITKAKPGEERILAELAGKMWGSHTLEDLTQEFRQLLAEPETALFLDWQGTTPVGFAQCQLRRDYVEGTASSPVGYLEGIFVEEACRGQGRAAKLLAMCEQWAREQGCSEFASDCELGNTASLAFHLALGFQEANRIICFTKPLK